MIPTLSNSSAATSTWTPTKGAHARWLFEQALDQPKPEREAFVRSMARGNSWLVESVLDLLSIESQHSPFSRPLTAGRGVPAPKPKVQVGGRIGNYRLREYVGSWGLGWVFRAEALDDSGPREDSPRKVALRVAHATHLSDKGRLRLLQQQCQIVGLRHPSIAQLLDFGSTPSGFEYWVLECVEGTSITEYANTHLLSMEERIRLFLQACDAISFAHQRRVVHRNLSPAHLLMTSSGELRVVGFGGLGCQPKSSVMPSSYASPQQLLRQPMTPRTDIWALGVVLFELLTGGRPFYWAGMSRVDMERQLEVGWVPRASESIPSIEMGGREVARRRGLRPGGLRRYLRGDLDRILQRALTSEPEKGYDNVSALTRDLECYLEGGFGQDLWRSFTGRGMARPAGIFSTFATA